jgi:hypothetical protein
MSLGTAIAHLYPNANPLRDYRIEDKGDGQGERISFWNTATLGVQPTAPQIAQAEIDAAAALAAQVTALTSERTALIALRDKVQAGTDLTPAEMRVLFRLLIRRSLLRD